VHPKGHDSHTHHASGRVFLEAFLATVALVAIKAIGAYVGHSLALAADAAHSLGDVAALGLGWYAERQLMRPPTVHLTFGWGRIEVLVGLVNAVVLWILAAILGWEAWRQWFYPSLASPPIMAGAAALALLVNLVLAWRFRVRQNLNQDSIFWHLTSDGLGSLGVLVAAAVITATGFQGASSLVTFAIALLIVWGAWGVVRGTLRVLLEATPAWLPLDDVLAALAEVPGVVRVHDLHVWSVGSQQAALACHVQVDESRAAGAGQDLLCELHDLLASFGIEHTTIQVETASEVHSEPSW
jgi:cobalt-zinc-cadmium efflux system protein